jgi:arylsulfatase A-like enzyme
MNRRRFLKTLAAGALAATVPGCRARAGAGAARPNVVLVLVDDLGWADSSTYGSRYYETPHLDRLAAQGMKFTNAYAACAVCSPTRAAVMTGRWPARLGVTDWIRARFQGGKIPEDHEPPSGWWSRPDFALRCPENALWLDLSEITIAEALKPAGYTSCHIGKWHLGADAWYPDRQGFDTNIGGCDYGQPPSYFDPYKNPRQGQIPTIEPRQEGEYLTDREGDEAAAFIRKHADRPFFLYMAHYAVHTPIQAKQDLIAKYKGKTATDRHSNATYAAMIESVDTALGKILDALDEAGVAGRTLVLFTSDNGGLVPITRNTPLRSGKGFPYEGGIREPLVVRWPGVVRPGSTCDVPVTSVDYFPTVCEAAGVALPADRPIDGKSILPLLGGTGGLTRDAIYWHFPHYRQGHAVPPYSIIRQGDWKLIRWHEGPTWELYNLADDLSEKNDLAARMPEKVKALDTRLMAHLKEVGAKMPEPNPEYKPKANT